jgi:Tfp pilus assembly protein PilV
MRATRRGWIWRGRASGGRERGETLIETLCTLTIVSLGVIALTTAMGYGFSFARQSRDSSVADSLLVAYSENLQSLAYEPCTASTTPYSATASSVLPTHLNGVTVIGSGTAQGSTQFLAQVTSVEYWNGATSPAGWTSGCPAAGDPGAQLLTISLSPGDGVVTRTLHFVKRET